MGFAPSCRLWILKGWMWSWTFQTWGPWIPCLLHCLGVFFYLLFLRALGDFAIQLVLYCLLSFPTSLLLIRSEWEWAWRGWDFVMHLAVLLEYAANWGCPSRLQYQPLSWKRHSMEQLHSDHCLWDVLSMTRWEIVVLQKILGSKSNADQCFHYVHFQWFHPRKLVMLKSGSFAGWEAGCTFLWYHNFRSSGSSRCGSPCDICSSKQIQGKYICMFINLKLSMFHQIERNSPTLWAVFSHLDTRFVGLLNHKERSLLSWEQDYAVVFQMPVLIGMHSA